MSMTDARRSIPGVDQLMVAPPFQRLLQRYPRERVVVHLREVLDETRERLSSGETSPGVLGPALFAHEVEKLFRRDEVPSLRPVINATGVILHTNLGRAPWAAAAREAVRRTLVSYSNLEFDLEEGRRGSRYVHCVTLLQELTGAEDALVVNNAAAGLVLALNTLALGRGVVVSRGELVEIGGGFRIPEILARSGTSLLEVGTTNKTRLEDYRVGVRGGDATTVLKVHRSNFRITGFTEETTVEELAGLAEEEGLHLVYDLGTGLLLDPERLGLPPEPTVPQGLSLGAHVLVVSGDKLLGGPQAGILLGRSELLTRMRENPLCRALRVDKATLAGLEATLRLYLEPDRALREIPVLRMISQPLAELESRTRAFSARISERGGSPEVTRGVSVVGGGTYPGAELPSWTLRLRPENAGATEVAERLRRGDPPVVVRVEGERLVLDLRTVDPLEEVPLLRRLREVL